MSQPIPGPVGPLRRRSDRFRTVVGWVLVAGAIALAVLAAVSAASAYRDGLDRIQRDVAARVTVVGVLLDDAAPAGSGAARSVRVSYADALGRPHVGQVPVTGFLPAGTPVRIEIDGDGRLGTEPPSRGDAVLAAAAVAAGVAVLGGMLLVMGWVGVRALITAHNHAVWEREWRRIEPQWSGRHV